MRKMMKIPRTFAALALTLGISSCAGNFYNFPGEQLVGYRLQEEQTPTEGAQENSNDSVAQEDHLSGEKYVATGCLVSLLGASAYAMYSFHGELKGIGGPVAGLATLVGGFGLAELTDALMGTEEGKLYGIIASFCFPAVTGAAAATINEFRKLEDESKVPYFLDRRSP